MNTSDRILIADRHDRSLIATTDLLQNIGYLCTPVHDGYEAFRALQLNAYDLLITEIHMPGNEELELVQFVSNYVDGMPVIIYTADPSLASAIASIQLSVKAYLIKPVAFEVLIDQVKKSIDAYKNIRRCAELEEGMQGCQEEIDQTNFLFASTLQETIKAIESTRRSFKSKQLAALRRKLERLLAGRWKD